MDALLALSQFAAFLLAAILVTLAPGPDNLMVLSLGMARGRRPDALWWRTWPLSQKRPLH
jgi:hypothetical protein